MIEWVQQNGETILACVGGLYLAALAFVKLTPSKKDDEVLSKIAVVAQGVAFVFGLKAKGPKPPEAPGA